MAIDLKRIPALTLQSIRKTRAVRMEALRSTRISWWVHWAALAEMFLPRRYRYFVTPNQYNRGTPMNQAIVDETGLLAARTLATGLLSNLTSPTKPWFRLGLHGQSQLPDGAAKQWLAQCTQTMLAVLADSNFYQCLGTIYHDLAVFGSAALLQYEDKDDVVHFYVSALGEFMFGVSARLEVDSFFREYTYTIRDAAQEFGMENLSSGTQTQAKNAAGMDQEIVICHAIEPNDDMYEGTALIPNPVPSRFKFREVYWEQGQGKGRGNTGQVLRMAGYMEKPFNGFRWDVTSNDPYGRSPGMDALPAVRQLQIEQRRKAEAIDKLVRPPMVASVSMKNEPMDILPGGVTFASDVAGGGFKPAFTVEPRIQEMAEDLLQVQARVKSTMFSDLFQMISDLQTVRTATEIDARREEKLVLLGPVIERTENELDDIIERLFAICSRRKLFPPAPPEIQGLPISIQYISVLAEAQRAASTAAIERLAQFIGGLVAVQPDIMDNWDTDKAVEDYADLLNVPPDQLRAMKNVVQIRAARTQAQQQAAALQTGQAAAQGAQTLSQTDVGGGQNALSMMMGRAA